MPFSNDLKTAFMQHLSGGTSWTKPTTLYVQLHVADPTGTCTVGVASNATRKLFTLTGLSNGLMYNAAEILWTSVPLTETYTWGSAWTAVTSGSALLYGQLTSPYPVVAGENFRLPAGALVLGVA